MKKTIIPLLAAIVLLTGCASLPERSYTVVEPYSDRYWDTGAEDTMRAESYQDLVNSLLLLIEERSEEGTIRYYVAQDEESYADALRAKREIREETLLGSYLLSDISVTYASGESYCTLTYAMTYREDVQDPAVLMSISDSQSLVDLLRLAVREDHDIITSQFIFRTPRAQIQAAVDGLWRELYLLQVSQNGELVKPGINPFAPPGELNSDGIHALEPGLFPGDEAIHIPSCPWEIHFYPDAVYTEIVEIILR